MFWTDIFGMVAGLGCIISSAITLLIFFPRNDENEFESSSLGRLYQLEVSQRKYGRHHLQDSVDWSERDRPELTFDVSIGTSSVPPSHLNNSLSFASRYEADDGCGAPPKYQSPSVQNLRRDRSGDRVTGALAPLPSAVNYTPLRPNRLGPNEEIELGNVQDLPTSGGWIGNWTSQFKSPLDVMQRRV